MRLKGQEMGLQLANLASQIKLNESQVNKNWETKNMEKPGTFAEDVPEKTDGGTPSEN